MDSTQKRHKPSIPEETLDDAGDDFEEDRISNLPDSILCYILSKIPTRNAVATAVLSSKWKPLFASIPNLVLDISDSSDCYRRNPSLNPDNFVTSLHHLLTVTLRDVPRIESLQLSCHHDYGNAHLEAWVSAALSLNPNRLSLCFTVWQTGVSTPGLFRCETLTHLTIHQDLDLSVPSSVWLPNLDHLGLHFVTFVESDSLERVLAGCPKLHFLFLERCYFVVEREAICFSSPSLYFLSVDNCGFGIECEIVFDMPRLQSLCYENVVAKYYQVKNLKCLSAAVIDVGPSEEEEGDNVVDLFAACSNVTSLYLSKATFSAIFYSFRPTPTFQYLTKLELRELNSHGWELLPQLLDKAHVLQTLIFVEGFSESRECYTIFDNSHPEHVPICLSSSLQYIDFEEFKGEEDELKLVEYFLRAAEVLEQMKFSFFSYLPMEKLCATWGRLLSLQECSCSGQIEIEADVKNRIAAFYTMDNSQPGL